jgi:flotillin
MLSLIKDRRVVGYRIIKGGRGLKIPIIEVIANVKIAGNEEEGLSNALVRFLGKNINDIPQIARENLEGTLRGILATLTPEEANEKRLGFLKRWWKEQGMI